MAHKSPYELRFEMLELAYKMAEHNAIAKSVKTQISEGVSHKDIVAYPAEEVDLDDVVKMAAKLNEFVSDNKHQ